MSTTPEDKTGVAVKAAKKPDPFLSLTTIPVQLTYNVTTPATVIKFPCKMALSEDDIAARQAFYNGPEDDQKSGLYAYQSQFLCRVLSGRPTLPGYNDFANELYKKQIGDNDPAKILALYLVEYRSAMMEKVVSDAVEMYNRLLMPTEFFR